MVIAAPGSGKTTVITHRTARLIQEDHVNPSEILVVTFTRAAAREMKERFLQVIGQTSTAVTFGTFHAVFFAILKHAYHLTGANIIREEQRFHLMKELVAKYRIEGTDENELAGDLLTEIGLVKNSAIPIEHYYATSCSEDVFRNVYRNYQDWMKQRRLLDFDDMLTLTWDLLNKRQDLCEAWQNKFRYVMVDEFQDINKLQYDITRLLAAPEDNLFIVGDDDQSIYRFRGARPEIMLHFKDEYPAAKVISLDNNYRSRAQIINQAAYFISHNQSRFPKEIHAARTDTDSRDNVVISVMEDKHKESTFLMEEIRTLVKKGASFSDFAVLARTNRGLFFFMEGLSAYNIPFVSREKIPDLYEHFIAKDFFAYLRLAKGGRARGDFLRIMNRPKRYIERDAIDDAEVSFEVLSMYYEEKSWVLERLWKLEKDLKMLKKMAPYAAITYIRKAIGYDDFLGEYADYRGLQPQELLDIADELLLASKAFPTLDAWEEHIETCRKNRKEQEKDRQVMESKDAVTLATLHGAKGLEYRYVFLVDVNEGNMPYRKATLPQELEEERRMFYVGMTRAKDVLYLLSVKEANNRMSNPSPYLSELMDKS